MHPQPNGELNDSQSNSLTSYDIVKELNTLTSYKERLSRLIAEEQAKHMPQITECDENCDRLATEIEIIYKQIEVIEQLLQSKTTHEYGNKLIAAWTHAFPSLKQELIENYKEGLLKYRDSFWLNGEIVKTADYQDYLIQKKEQMIDDAITRIITARTDNNNDLPVNVIEVKEIYELKALKQVFQLYAEKLQQEFDQEWERKEKIITQFREDENEIERKWAPYKDRYKNLKQEIKSPQPQDLFQICDSGDDNFGLFSTVLKQKLKSEKLIDILTTPEPPHCNYLIHYAAKSGSKKIIEYIIKKHKDSLYFKNLSGCVAIHLAAANGHKEIVEMFVKRDKSLLNATDAHGETPLHKAAFKNQVETCSILLKLGAAVSHQTEKNGLTPLHIATKQGHIGAIALLLKAGADYLNLKNKITTHLLMEENCIEVASHSGKPRILKTYLESPKVTVPRELGERLLKEASEKQHWGIVLIWTNYLETQEKIRSQKELDTKIAEAMELLEKQKEDEIQKAWQEINIKFANLQAQKQQELLEANKKQIANYLKTLQVNLSPEAQHRPKLHFTHSLQRIPTSSRCDSQRDSLSPDSLSSVQQVLKLSGLYEVPKKEVPKKEEPTNLNSNDNNAGEENTADITPSPDPGR